MDLKELKQEAKEFIDNRFKHEVLNKRVQEFFTYWELLCSIIDFAEPREKRIEELEAQIEKMKSDVISERDEAKRLEDIITYTVLNNILAKWGIKEK